MSAIVKTVAGLTAVAAGAGFGIGGNYLIQNYDVTSKEDTARARAGADAPEGIRTVEPMECAEAKGIYKELGALTMQVRKYNEFGEGELSIAPDTPKEQLAYVLGIMDCEVEPIACDEDPILYNINELYSVIHERDNPDVEFVPADPAWFQVCNDYGQAWNDGNTLHVGMEMFEYGDQSVTVQPGGRNLSCTETRSEQTEDIHDDINDLFSVGPIAEYRERGSGKNITGLEVIMEFGDELQVYCDLEDIAYVDNTSVDEAYTDGTVTTGPELATDDVELETEDTTAAEILDAQADLEEN